MFFWAFLVQVGGMMRNNLLPIDAASVIEDKQAAVAERGFLLRVYNPSVHFIFHFLFHLILHYRALNPRP